MFAKNLHSRLWSCEIIVLWPLYLYTESVTKQYLAFFRHITLVIADVSTYRADWNVSHFSLTESGHLSENVSELKSSLYVCTPQCEALLPFLHQGTDPLTDVLLSWNILELSPLSMYSPRTAMHFSHRFTSVLISWLMYFCLGLEPCLR